MTRGSCATTAGPVRRARAVGAQVRRSRWRPVAGSRAAGVGVGLGGPGEPADAHDRPRIAALDEPQVAVGAGRDPVRAAIRGEPGRAAREELGDDARGRDPADAARAVVRGEPQVAVRAGRDPAPARRPGGRSNSVTTPAGVIRPIRPPSPVLREPQVAVRPSGDRRPARCWPRSAA